MTVQHSSRQERAHKDDVFELLPFLRFPGCALILAICLAIGGCFALPFVFYYVEGGGGEYVLTTFDCGNGREILITAANSWEVSQPIFSVVKMDGKTVVPTTYVSDSNGDDKAFEFEARFAANRNVVGIIERYRSFRPHYIVVHDFRDGTSWPRGEMYPHFEGSRKFTRQDLEALLNAEFKEKQEAGRTATPQP